MKKKEEKSNRERETKPDRKTHHWNTHNCFCLNEP